MHLGIKTVHLQKGLSQAVGKIKLTVFALQCLSVLCLNLVSDIHFYSALVRSQLNERAQF